MSVRVCECVSKVYMEVCVRESVCVSLCVCVHVCMLEHMRGVCVCTCASRRRPCQSLAGPAGQREGVCPE